MEKIVLQLESTKIQWLKAEARRLNVSVEDYLERVIYNHSEIAQNNSLLSPVSADDLEVPDQDSFEKSLDYLMEKNRELYKRLA